MHTQCFHFMYASPRQASLYSRLNVPHYLESASAMMKLKITSSMKANPELNCVLQYHLPDQNLTTPFLLVFNHLPPAVYKIFQKVDWECIARTPLSEVEKVLKKGGSSTAGQQCQFWDADFGNTLGLNQSRANDPSGVSRPILLKGTSPTIQDTLLMLSPITLSIMTISKESFIWIILLRPFEWP